MIGKKIVGVSGDPLNQRYGALFIALAQLYPVEFCEVSPRNFETVDALIVLDGNLAAGLEAAAAGVPSFVAMGGTGEPDRVANAHVRFGSSRRIDVYLRGQTMVASRKSEFHPLVLRDGDDLLASEDGCPAWIARPCGSGACDLVAASPPALREDEYLFQYLNARRFMELLPLMHFLRQRVTGIGWDGPAPRACFVFDDPSFYLRSYGFLNFRRLAEHATAHNYFVSVATIPLDTWWVNKDVAKTFQSFNPRLSVLVHGNNHTRHEMLSARKQFNHQAVAAQAMHRMERLARRRGISFLKVMEAPYGALANSMFQNLLRLGYEGALCTTELLLRHNPGETWPAAIGMDRSEMLGGGLPVIPRIKMTAGWRNDVLLAAFLRQPIVVVGHHQDAADEMTTLKEFAETVNRLEGVTGSNLEGMLRTNYKQRIEGAVLAVRMYSRRLNIRIPPGIQRLQIHRPWLEKGRTELLVISVGNQAKSVEDAGSVTDELQIPDGAGSVEVESKVENPLDLAAVNLPSEVLWPVARKIMKEIRDRSTSVLPMAGWLRRRA